MTPCLRGDISMALFLGSILFFHSPAQYFRLAIPVIVITVITALFFIWIIGVVIRAHKKKVTTGKEGLLLETGITTSNLDPEGMVRIHGELWSAESPEEKITKGEKVKVIKVEGMKLFVKRSGQ